jgi:hypothetical protein
LAEARWRVGRRRRHPGGEQHQRADRRGGEAGDQHRARGGVLGPADFGIKLRVKPVEGIFECGVEAFEGEDQPDRKGQKCRPGEPGPKTRDDGHRCRCEQGLGAEAALPRRHGGNPRRCETETAPEWLAFRGRPRRARIAGGWAIASDPFGGPFRFLHPDLLQASQCMRCAQAVPK